MAVGPKIVIATVLADLNLAVQYRIAIYIPGIMYMQVRNIGKF